MPSDTHYTYCHNPMYYIVAFCFLFHYFARFDHFIAKNPFFFLIVFSFSVLVVPNVIMNSGYWLLTSLSFSFVPLNIHIRCIICLDISDFCVWFSRPCVFMWKILHKNLIWSMWGDMPFMHVILCSESFILLLFFHLLN